MKKYLTLIIVFILLGAIIGIVFITKSTTDINLEKKRQPKQEKVIIDETSFPPVDLETNIDNIVAPFDVENAKKFTFKVKNKNYNILLPDYCSIQENESILCKSKFPFSLTVEHNQISDPENNSESNFTAGDYDIKVKVRDNNKYAFFSITNNDTAVYISIKTDNYKLVEKNIWEVISTFSVENPAL